MATINGLTSPHPFLSLKPNPKPSVSHFKPLKPQILSSKGLTQQQRYCNWAVVGSVSNETDVIPVQSIDTSDRETGVVIGLERGPDVVNQVVGGFGNEVLSFEGGAGGFSPSSTSGSSNWKMEKEDMERLIDRGINAIIVLAAGSFAITKLLTIDHDYWHGWTIYEILRYAPQHNWIAYEEVLKRNPVLAKMVISGVVYSLGIGLHSAMKESLFLTLIVHVC